MDQTDKARTEALGRSETEQAELDVLLVKLATGGLGFSVALGAFSSANQTGWLVGSWFVMLACVVFVVLSKYLSVEANRQAYGSGHGDKWARRYDRLVGLLNYAAGVCFIIGALLTVLHVLNAEPAAAVDAKGFL